MIALWLNNRDSCPNGTPAPSGVDHVKVFISIKRAGDRRHCLARTPFELPDAALTLQQLIECVVTSNVTDYNSKRVDADFVRYLTQPDIDDQLTVGKVGFGRRFASVSVDASDAVDAARQAFLDGLYRVFVDDAEVRDLDENLPLHEGSLIAFVRLTFLAGRLW